MKKALLLASVTAVLSANTAYADLLGANAEFGIFKSENTLTTNDSSEFNLEDESGQYFSADVQHFIPLIPNVRVDAFSLSTTGTSTTAGVSSTAKLDIETKDITGYYGLGLLWVGVEGGLTVRNLEMDYDVGGSTTSISESAIPMLYLAATIDIPGTGITIAAESKTVSSFSDVTITDETFKVQYSTPFLVGVEAGYRSIEQEVKNTESKNSGYFIGVTVDI
ncbi:TIGR04219 family outer membrane beta-barrel protein [Marinomonas dokdonensis]|uniref:TIGR04219 family outer membrane beta-barrel protein n=1 Tax=Marinomonas dokdonensis TaxID=328224 RepID=UPI0040553F81